MNYKYYIFEVGNKDYTIDFDNGRVDDLNTISERAAEHHWGESDSETSWPVELILVDENNEEYAFQIEMDYLPEFSSTQFDM